MRQGWFQGPEVFSSCWASRLASSLSLQTWDFSFPILPSILITLPRLSHFVGGLRVRLGFGREHIFEQESCGLCTCACVCAHPHLSPHACTWLFDPVLKELSVCSIVFVFECVCISNYLNHLLYHVLVNKHLLEKRWLASVEVGK